MLYKKDEMTMPSKTAKLVSKSWIIFAFVMIFNPNINIYDLLPDFIGYFILAKLFEKAADAAPYFEEARSAFIKLGYISLAKLPAVILVRLVRSENTMDNDVIALTALVFATLEIIFLLPAIKNSFDALLYLGERTDAASLIKSDSLISTDALRSFTYVFTIFKCLIYSLPEMLRLTRSVDMGSATSFVTGSAYYPWAIMASLLLGFIVGGVWLSRIIKYTNAIVKEGKFKEAIEKMAHSESYDEYLKKLKARSLNKAFLMFILAAIFTIDLSFDNFDSVNILPGFIFGAWFLAGLVIMCKHINNSSRIKIVSVVFGVMHIIASVVEFVFSTIFLTKFGYDSLLELSNDAAVTAYKKVELTATISSLFYVCLIVLFFIIMCRYVTEKIKSARHYPEELINDPYLRDAKKKTLILSIIGLCVGLSTLANVFINGNVKILFTNSGDVTMPAIIVSSLPWFGLLVMVFNIVYIFYSAYYFNYIKEDL